MNSSRAIALLPDEDIAKAAATLIRVVTPEAAIEKGLQIGAALANPELVFGVRQQIAQMVNALKIAFGAEETFSKAAALELANSIFEEYAHLNVEEIALVFKKGRAGEYGKQYHKLNAVTVLAWLADYSKSEERLGYFERKHKSAPKEPDSGIMEALLAAGVFTGDGGTFAVEAEEGPIKSRAQLLREQADKLEAEEAANLAKSREKTRVFTGMLTGKLAFEQFAHANYYLLLTKEEAEVLKASGSRLLLPEEQSVFKELSIRWQEIVKEWEERPLASADKLDG